MLLPSEAPTPADLFTPTPLLAPRASEPASLLPLPSEQQGASSLGSLWFLNATAGAPLPLWDICVLHNGLTFVISPPTHC